MFLGEARSKCDHLAGVPLAPMLAQQLYMVTLIKGAVATTAIEGNTLTEEEVRGIIEGTFKAPPSRQYQEQEIRNVIDALGDIHARIVAGDSVVLTSELVCEFNRIILKDLELDDDVVPGEIRTHSVAVGKYRGAPAVDCGYLLVRLVDWLNSDLFVSTDPEIAFALTVAKAIYAHLYLAWIHPFGDGNGRTARLVEFLILAQSGMVPMPAAHLLSNHYNLTRDRYYRELAHASQSGGDTLGFLAYAIEGFVDGIREVIGMIRDQQLFIAWVSYVHERFGNEPNTKASERMRTLVLGMPIGVEVPRSHIKTVNPKVAEMYATAGPRTLSRDLNHLVKMDLMSRHGPRNAPTYRASSDLMLAFLPAIALTEASAEDGNEPTDDQLRLAV